MKLHYTDLRLRNNAGMDFPACYAGAKLLDTDKGRLPTTTNRFAVTCKHCLRTVAAERARGMVRDELRNS